VNKLELLAELDSHFAARMPEEYKRSVGPAVNPDLIKIYQVRGAIVRANDRAEEHDVVFYVYDEDGGSEHAYYSGDPINFFWRLKLIDHITITNEWNGRVFRSNKPTAICRVLQDPDVGEKWVLLTETDPDWATTPPTIEDITGEVLTNY